MSWWRDGMVKVRHKPTGIEVEADLHGRSIYRNKLAALAMLRGKLWSLMRGGHLFMKDQPVRSYTDQDFARKDIVEMERHRRGGSW